MRQRCDRAVAALESANVPYAVIGGHAVANWVARIDEGAVRNTRDVNILISRESPPLAIAVMESAGFVYVEVAGVSMFIDGPNGKPSQGVHLLFAHERVRPTDVTMTPEVTESEPSPAFRVISLEALVRMKLESHRDKDRAHLRDLIGVGVIDSTWPLKFLTAIRRIILCC